MGTRNSRANARACECSSSSSSSSSSLSLSFRVSLSLVDLSGTADPDGHRLRETLLRSEIWKDNAALQKRVTRFLKPRDQYLAYASMLFQSRAYYRVHVHHHLVDKQRPLPIAALPRTKYNKPYIPWTRQEETQPVCESSCIDGIPEEDLFSISVSHQFPFCGIAELLPAQQYTNAGASAASLRRPPLVVGLDIVVFDPVDPRLYASPQEFLDVFSDQFTEEEWTHGIRNNQALLSGDESSMMREFYLRWATKEAYTKALGVGMGLAFGSFEIHLHDGSSDTSSSLSASVWNRIQTNDDRCSYFRGTVRFPRDTTKEDEEWSFCFLPLDTKGCACVCINDGSSSGNPLTDLVDVSWVDLDTLVEFHKGS